MGTKRRAPRPPGRFQGAACAGSRVAVARGADTRERHALVTLAQRAMARPVCLCALLLAALAASASARGGGDNTLVLATPLDAYEVRSKWRHAALLSGSRAAAPARSLTGCRARKADPPGWSFKACANSVSKWTTGPRLTEQRRAPKADELPASLFWSGWKSSPAWPSRCC